MDVALSGRWGTDNLWSPLRSCFLKPKWTHVSWSQNDGRHKNTHACTDNNGGTSPERWHERNFTICYFCFFFTGSQELRREKNIFLFSRQTAFQCQARNKFFFFFSVDLYKFPHCQQERHAAATVTVNKCWRAHYPLNTLLANEMQCNCSTEIMTVPGLTLFPAFLSGLCQYVFLFFCEFVPKLLEKIHIWGFHISLPPVRHARSMWKGLKSFDGFKVRPLRGRARSVTVAPISAEKISAYELYRHTSLFPPFSPLICSCTCPVLFPPSSRLRAAPSLISAPILSDPLNCCFIWNYSAFSLLLFI